MDVFMACPEKNMALTWRFKATEVQVMLKPAKYNSPGLWDKNLSDVTAIPVDTYLYQERSNFPVPCCAI